MNERKQTFDFSSEVDVTLPQLLQEAYQNMSLLPATLEKLLALEKKTRLAADLKSTQKVVNAIIQLILKSNEWHTLVDHIALLCKRRAQLTQVIQEIVKKGVVLVEEAPSKELKILLISTLREVAEGKIFVELERARLTRILSKIKEEEGNLAEASSILQEIQVETVGSMDKKEKAEFLLEQFRLTLANHDFVRSDLISKKVSTDILEEDDFQDLKLKFYRLLIVYHLNSSNFIEVSKAYRSIYDTKCIQEDPNQWKPAMVNCAIFLMISKHSPEQFDMMLRLKQLKNVAELPTVKDALELYTRDELIGYPLKQEAEWKNEEAFQGKHGLAASKAIQTTINQHNVRVIAKYYSRIRVQRMCELLNLDPISLEKCVSEMVSEANLKAKIDRPAGIIKFNSNDNSNRINNGLNNWSSNISSLLGLLEKTSHLINKETMVHNF